MTFTPYFITMDFFAMQLEYIAADGKIQLFA